MNGELSKMTTQMLAKLPTQGSPLLQLSKFILLWNRLFDFAQTFTVYSSWSSPFTKSTLMLGFHFPLTSKKQKCVFSAAPRDNYS